MHITNKRRYDCFRDQNLDQDSVRPFMDQKLTVQNVHVDHIPPTLFDVIVHNFIELHSINPEEVNLTGAKDGEIGNNFSGSNLSELFCQFHNEKV